MDNGSTDGSLRTAEAAAAAGRIELVRRAGTNDGAADHGAALDVALERAAGDYLFTLDCDAWARAPGWLSTFIEALEGAGASHAGAFKEPAPATARALAWLRGRRAPPDHVRPCRALYRLDLLRAHGLSFAPDRAPDGRLRTVGQAVHERLLALGHRPAVLPHDRAEALVGHVRHAVMALNADRFPALRPRARRAALRRIERLLASPEARELLRGTDLP